ncbi:macrophage mannose receptor 1-like [Etheostoma cragini]|uniref:macrophage mannose receptor 1-like n=1 Tax=Etheostoma cragini TaxID=417921 RepID=UPI00155EB294|nr:macrophage mannose receptor 1-like [Etheostoma cragini]
MDCLTLILLVLGFSLHSCSRFPPRKYYYVNLAMNWANAQLYCREKYSDLATITSMDDVSRLQPAFTYSWAWIGLADDPKSWRDSMGNDSNSWRSSATGETSKTGYKNWSGNIPSSTNGNENCVHMCSDGTWNDFPCGSYQSFVCYYVTNENKKTYVFISTLKTWTNARDYCRKYYTDLPMIENNVENTAVFSTKPANAEPWIGLYRVPWTWSDKTQSSFTNWLTNSPENYGGTQYCNAENPLHEWNDITCSAKFPFICHQVFKLKTTVRMTLKTRADLTDPATNSQILQQIEAELKRRGWTDFKMRWMIQPKKFENAKLTELPSF